MRSRCAHPGQQQGRRSETTLTGGPEPGELLTPTFIFEEPFTYVASEPNVTFECSYATRPYDNEANYGYSPCDSFPGNRLTRGNLPFRTLGHRFAARARSISSCERSTRR